MSALAPPDLLDRVVTTLDPVAVYLFGSRARGDHRPDSDIDLFVVVEDHKLNAAAVHRLDLQRGAGAAIDLKLASRTKFSRRRRLVGTLDEAVSQEGVELYSREQPVALDLGDEPVETLVGEWLEIAGNDLTAAEMLSSNDNLLNNVAVLLQQALEKTLKAEIAAAQMRPLRTHELETLAAGLAVPFGPADLKAISGWAVEPRYPVPDPPPQIADVRRLAPVIRAYHTAVRERLLPRG